MIPDVILKSLLENLKDNTINIKRFYLNSEQCIKIILYPHSSIDKIVIPKNWKGYKVKVERRD